MRLDVAATAVSPSEYGFTPQRLEAPANTAVSLRFSNPTTVAHIIVVLEPIDASSGRIIDPGGTDQLDFTTPGAGSYQFVCTVHPEMTGVLEID
jgi:plastocyanin